MTDLTTLRALILGDGETRIDSYEAAERVLAAGWRQVTPFPDSILDAFDCLDRAVRSVSIAIPQKLSGAVAEMEAAQIAFGREFAALMAENMRALRRVASPEPRS